MSCQTILCFCHTAQYIMTQSNNFTALSACLMVFFLMSPIVIQSVSGNDKYESEIQTITKCLEDLTSSSVDIRKRAVLILGKYSHSAAKSAIIRSLRDDDASIRRSALVSMTETRPFPENSRNEVLTMIGDEDVHIRRIASSYIPDIMGFGRTFIRIRGQIRTHQFPPDLQLIIKKAFTDNDSIVRKNMITGYQHFKGIIDNSTILGLLHDSDRDVRILALNAISSSLNHAEFVNQTKFLENDSDKTLRLHYVKILARLNITLTINILKSMTDDDDFEISTEALIILFENNNFSYYPELKKRLSNHRISQISGTKIIRKLGFMKDGGEAELIALFSHKNIGFRELALQTYGDYFWKTANLNLLIDLLDDPLQQIRSRVTYVLLRNGKLDMRDLQRLSMSHYSDIREFVITYSKRLDNVGAMRLLIDLIIDDDNSIRIKALMEIINRRLDNWQELLAQTLMDDEDEIGGEMVRMIRVSNNKETIAFVRGILEISENKKLLDILNHHNRFQHPAVIHRR